MKTKFDFKSIKFKLWCYFLSVSIVILGLVWLLQVFLLNNSYERMKIKQVDEVATLINHAYLRDDENLTSDIRELSVTSDLYVMMESNGVLLLFTPEEDSTLPVYRYKNEIPKLKEMLEDSEETSNYFKFTTNFEHYDTLAYCKNIVDEEVNIYLYIFTPLYPVDSTVSILKDQLLIVTIVALMLAFILALLLSNRISRPLNKITQSAKKMGQGDYDVQFDTRSSYSEINNLSQTLNKAATELGRADNLRRDLVANVSHDLKTPLTLIKSYAEKIKDLTGGNKVKREKDLDVIINEVDRMTALVTDMSEMSKMQNKKIELTYSAFDLSEEISTLVKSYKILEDQEGYSFKVSLPKECYVEADQGRIKQVISNLVGNAIKYCADNKEISITLKKQGKYARFEVTDRGPGISPEDQEHIWDRYYRTSANYQRPETGSGLGLSIVKEILNLHNAAFGVESTIGKGSTFWFELDIKKK